MSIFKIFRINTLFVCVLFSLLCLTVNAQDNSEDESKMSVISFEEANDDKTAILTGTMRTYNDSKGEKKAALIKVETTEYGFRFDTGSAAALVGEIEPQSQKHPAEIWVYVQDGVRKITIQHSKHGVIRDHDFGKRLKGGRTYILKLDTPDAEPINWDTEQLLQMNIIPAKAELSIEGMRQTLDSYGRFEAPFAIGKTYKYRIVAENYHTTEGTFKIEDPNNMQIINIRLKQAFGYLSVNDNNKCTGADIFVDGNLVGKYPLQNREINSGKHIVTVKKELYSPYEETIEMTDSAFVDIKPILTENCANIKLTVKDNYDAQIYCDGVLKGTREWEGRLEAGTRFIEVKKDSHKTYSQRITVNNGVDASILLNKPIPIYGTLDIKTEPIGAEVFIDGKIAETASPIIKSLLIGTHSIEIRKKGYKTEKRTVQIQEGATETLNIKMTDFCNIKLYTSPTWADVYLDGIRLDGSSPYPINVIAGKHEIAVYNYGYTSHKKEYTLNAQSKDMEIKLHRDLTRRNEFYMQVGYNVLGAEGMNTGMGCYIANFNMEANYILGFRKSEPIYWIDTEYGSKPYTATYKLSGYNGKLGWGIRCSSRFRITPQIGCQILQFKEEIESGYEVVPKASVASLTGGIRINFAMAPCLGLSVSPEYIYPISKSEGYKAISDVSDKIKKYAEGFGCNISLNLFF